MAATSDTSTTIPTLDDLPNPIEPGATVDAETGLFFELLAAEIIIGIIFVLFLFLVFSWAILRTGKLEHPASLVTALSLLTFVALCGAIWSTASPNGSNEPLIAIASAGIGAIASAVSTSYSRGGRGDPPPPPPD